MEKPMPKIQKINSRDNSKLKFARRVRDGREEGVIFLEGVRLAEEALRSGLKIAEGFVSDELADDERGREVIDALYRRNVPVAEVPEKIFRSVADTAQSQGIVLIAEKPEFSLSAIGEALTIPDSIPIVLFLEKINNPSNLGAVIRTAEAAGVAGIITSENSTDAFSPKALRAAMGSSLRIPVWENAPVEDAFHWAGELRMITTGSDINATQTYTGIDWKRPRLLIFGSEAHGMSGLIRERIGELIQIPMANAVESLNLAVSCGIILFEARRQVFE